MSLDRVLGLDGIAIDHLRQSRKNPESPSFSLNQFTWNASDLDFQVVPFSLGKRRNSNGFQFLRAQLVFWTGRLNFPVFFS